MRQVRFVSHADAEAHPALSSWAVISITDINYADANLQHGWHDVLRLKFDDIDDISHDGYVRMGELQARSVVDFVRRVEREGVDGVLVHCWAGVSRSAGVAKWIAQQYDLPFLASYSLYNKHVYSLLCKIGDTQ
jgi:predicted protein tyrosine phosphatase